jgi:hypothetical protein
VNQNRLFVGVVILVVFVILAISGSVFLFGEWKSRQAGIGQRVPLPGLGYCSSAGARPCIMSFNLDPAGKMVISIWTEDPSAPAFYLKIKRGESETMYGCRKAGGSSNTVACTGEAMPSGETLQFLMLSKRDDTLLAEGTFAIIGLALATPEFASTPTFVPSWDRPPR